jgi:hypothetical protein
MFNAYKGHLGVFRRVINDFNFFELILDLDRLFRVSNYPNYLQEMKDLFYPPDLYSFFPLIVASLSLFGSSLQLSSLATDLAKYAA